MTDPNDAPRWPELPSRSRARITNDVNDEIEGWLADRAAEWRARGLGPDEAMAKARAEFGDVERTREYCVAEDRAAQRRTARLRFVGEAWEDVRIAARGMVRSPVLAVVLLATMALGIGATTAIYSVVHALLLRPLPWADAERVVQLHGTQDGSRGSMGQLSARAFVTLREQATALSAVSAIASGGGALTDDGPPESVPGLRMSANTLELLGARPMIGTGFEAGSDSAGAEPVLILSHALWQRRFGGDPSIVGRTIDVSSVRRRVLGVMGPDFIPPIASGAELFTPLDVSPVMAHPERKDKFRFLQVIGRVRPERADVAQADVDRIMATLVADRPDSYTGMGAELVPLREVMTGELRPQLVALTAASLILLLIACANIASVLLARLVSRQQELGVRVALGAGRGRLVRQLLAESLALALIGGTLGVGVGTLGVRILREIGTSALPSGIEFGMDMSVLWFAVALSIACGVLFGVGPAIAAGMMAPRTLAVGGTRGTEGQGRLRLRRALVVTQVALSVAMLMGAGLLGRSLRNLMAVDLGYRTTGRVAFRLSLPGQRYDSEEKEDAFYARVFEQLEAIPGVSGVAAVGNLPLTGSSGASLVIEGRPYEGDRPPEVRYTAASDKYFEVLGIPMRRGRAFQPEDANPSVLAVIITESAAKKFWGTDDPIGARLRLGPDPRSPLHTVVGVAGDVILGPQGTPAPTVYASSRHDRWGGGYIVLRTDNPSIASSIRRAVGAVDPLLPIGNILTIDEIRGRALADHRLPLQLVGGFSVLAVILAALGLYGVGASLVAARRRELGVRMALGATSAGVLRLILRDGLVIVAIGVAIGVPLALFLGRQLGDLLYGVRPTDPVTLVSVAGLLTLIGLAASAIPARRASRVDPAQAIRPD